jgi:uncharacterized membrane protein YfcA
VLLLGLALSLLIGVALGFFGGGGSILAVPLLVYGFGLDARQAIATSLLVIGTASGLAALQHWSAGNVQLRTGLLFGGAGMAGAYVGGRAGAYLDPSLLLLLFAAMMLATALALWRGSRPLQHRVPAQRAPARLLAQGLGVGLVTGLVGAGGGFLIVPALVLWAGLPMRTAVGTSLLVIALNCAAGLSGYLSHVRIDYRLIAGITAAAVAGSVAGARLAGRIDPSSLRRAFAAFLLVMASAILLRETDVWLATARAALPGSLPQLAFALLALCIGIATGRASRRAGGVASDEPRYGEGAGI